MSQFHRFDDSIHDQRGAETCSEPQKEHLATLVATQSLQGSVVHHLDGPFEGSLEIETSPAFSEIPGIGNRSVVRNQTWMTHGNGVVIPIGRALPNPPGLPKPPPFEVDQNSPGTVRNAKRLGLRALLRAFAFDHNLKAMNCQRRGARTAESASSEALVRADSAVPP